VKLGLAEEPLGKMRDLKRKANIGELIDVKKWHFSIVLAAFDFGCFSIKSVGLLSS
jgi:hypothetical protein